jgi:hypothetical protein
MSQAALRIRDEHRNGRRSLIAGACARKPIEAQVHRRIMVSVSN